MELRQQRGLVIAATMEIRRQGVGFVVPSQSQHGKYTVDAGRTRCTCPDFEERQMACKHLFAVEFFVKRETVTNDSTGETVVSETRATRITYGQNWPAYNAAQTSEKDHFCRLLRDLCAGVPEPEQTRGRPRLPLADMLFAAGFKVYSTVSARRFMTDLRDAQVRGLIGHTPHYNSIFNVIESETVTPILYGLITASSLPLKEVECDFAVDSTGFGTSRRFNYYSTRYERQQTSSDWLKAHAMVGVKTNVVTALRVTHRNDGDYPQMRPLVGETAKHFTLREVSADKAYLGRDNQELVVRAGAEPFIPFKSNSKPDGWSPLWNRLYHYFAMNREEFLAHYHKRSNVEATFSAIKRVFGDTIRSRTPTAQINEVLLKVLCHNLRCLVHAIHELGVTPVFERVCPQRALLAQEVLGL